MEAMWTWFLPSMLRLGDILQSGTIGDIVNISITFGFPIDRERVLEKKLGGGTTLDLGIYGVYLAQVQ